MKKCFFSLVVATLVLALAGWSLAFDVAISTQAGWYGQEAADREMTALADAIKGSVSSVTLFPADKQADLATWVKNNTSDGQNDILVLSGQFPSTIYAPGNTQVDDSLAEIFLNSGNTILNTGDYMFYVVDSAGTNGAAGLQTMMNLPAISMWDDDTPMVVTNEGKKYTPSLVDYASDRPTHLDELVAPWEALVILAQNAAGTRAEPCIVMNTATKGMLGTFYQTASQDDDPRAKVMSEFIINYFASTTAVNPADSSATTWGAIKGN
jgi:hypothetical protein